MVGLVVVSHSPALAEAAVALASQMLHGADVAIVVAAGTADGGTGTDATLIADAVTRAASGDGVLVLMDLGSAVLSAGLAVELVGDLGDDVVLSDGPFVEGLVAAAVTASTGAPLDRVAREASDALRPKETQLHS